VILLAALSIPWRGASVRSAPEVAGVAGRGALTAGAAVRPLDLGPAPVLGGFPRWRWSATGVADKVTARALVLTEPGCSVALVSAELVLVPRALAEAVRVRVADLRLDAVVVAATHTHAGPGGYWDALAGRFGATGPYDEATFERMVESMAGAVRLAAADRAPATVSVARGRLTEVVQNRDGGQPDGRLLAVRVARRSGKPVAELVSFAAHPTMLGRRNTEISGDWVGRLLVLGSRGPRLFFQGAVGDQSVRPPTVAVPGAEAGADAGAGGVAGAEVRARMEAEARAVDAALAGLEGSPAVESPSMAVATARLGLPAMDPGAVPGWLRPATVTVAGGTFSRQASVTALRLGPALLLFMAAEPVAAVGQSLRDAAGPDAEVISLAGDYLGYVETEAAFRAGTGEAKRSYFGPGLAAALQGGVTAAAREAERLAGAATP
jgi:hypothetical protein